MARVLIEKINTDIDTQTRVSIDQETVDAYCDSVESKASFPAIILFTSDNGKSYVIGDGWHRTLAFIKAGKKSIKASVQVGTTRDALLYSISSNSTHGLRRTNKDKRNCVAILLDDKEWNKKSNNLISKKAFVSLNLVNKMVRENSLNSKVSDKPKVKIGADGRRINTKNIGKALNSKFSRVNGIPLSKYTTEIAQSENISTALELTKKLLKSLEKENSK